MRRKSLGKCSFSERAIALGLSCSSIFDLGWGPGAAVAEQAQSTVPPVTRGRTKPQRLPHKVLCALTELLNICLKTGKACSFGMPSVCFSKGVLDLEGKREVLGVNRSCVPAPRSRSGCARFVHRAANAAAKRELQRDPVTVQSLRVGRTCY